MGDHFLRLAKIHTRRQRPRESAPLASVEGRACVTKMGKSPIVVNSRLFTRNRKWKSVASWPRNSWVNSRGGILQRCGVGGFWLRIFHLHQVRKGDAFFSLGFSFDNSNKPVATSIILPPLSRCARHTGNTSESMQIPNAPIL